MNKRLIVTLPFAVAGVSLLIATGCKKERAPDTKPPVVSSATSEKNDQDEERAFFDALDAAYMEANQLLEQSQTNEAVAVFENLCADTRWKQWSNRLFSEKIRFQLYLGQEESVREQVMQACAAGPIANANSGLQTLLPFVHETRGLEEAFTLAAAVETTPNLATELSRYIREWRFFAALNAAEMPRATEALDVIAKTFPAADVNRILGQAIDSLLANNRLDDAKAILTIARSIPNPSPGCAQIIAATAVRLAALSDDWDETGKLFAAAANSLGDVSLKRLFTQIMPVMRRAQQFETIDHCAKMVLTEHGDKPAAAAQAAQFWIESAMITNRAAVPARLTEALKLKVNTETVANLFTRYFYDLINDTAIIGELLPIADTLIAAADAETAKVIKTMRLDGAFVVDDFDKAISYLETGIPDREAGWHKMALAKVRAHRALKNGQLREAVGFFREFMSYIDDVKDDDTVDPSTGIQHTKDMLRGRNSKRIAEILAAIPDTEAADKARAEAAAYYRKALDETKDDETRAVITAEAGDLLK